jgi:hypothetical protein
MRSCLLTRRSWDVRQRLAPRRRLAPKQDRVWRRLLLLALTPAMVSRRPEDTARNRRSTIRSRCSRSPSIIRSRRNHSTRSPSIIRNRLRSRSRSTIRSRLRSRSRSTIRNRLRSRSITRSRSRSRDNSGPRRRSVLPSTKISLTNKGRHPQRPSPTTR